jgi:hypothetical protein
MEKQGCVDTSYTDNDCNITRLDGSWRAFKKADCFRLQKDGFVRLEKDGLVRLEKDGLVRLEKNGLDTS